MALSPAEVELAKTVVRGIIAATRLKAKHSDVKRIVLDLLESDEFADASDGERWAAQQALFD